MAFNKKRYFGRKDRQQMFQININTNFTYFMAFN